MNEIWNLDPLYKGFDDPAFEADMTVLKERLDAMDALMAQLPSMDALEGLRAGITTQEEVSHLLGKLVNFAM